MFRRLASSLNTSVRSSVIRTRQTKRNGSGHGHGHGEHAEVAHPVGPYEKPHPHPYPNEALLFGIKDTDKREGWEILTYGIYGICAVIITFGMYMKEDDSFKGWARREALAREKVIENGGEVVFGQYNSMNIKYEKEEMDKMPIISEAE